MFDGDKISLSSKVYTGERLLNSPTSLKACKIEGVQPKQLLKLELPAEVQEYNEEKAEQERERERRPEVVTEGSRKKSTKDAEPEQLPLNVEKAMMRHNALEKERRALVEAVRGRYQIIVSSSASQPKRKETSKSVADADRATSLQSAAGSHRATTAGLDDDEDEEAEEPQEEGELESAKYFLVLKKQHELEVSRRNKWNAKETKIRELNEKLATTREKENAKASQAFEERLERAKRTHEATLERTRQRTEERMKRLDSRIEKAKEKKVELQTKVDPSHGAAERDAYEKAQQEALNKLLTKIDKANETTKRVAARVDRERALKSYAKDIQTMLHENQSERYQRKLEHKRDVFYDRVETQRQRKETLDADKNAVYRERQLKRERVTRQREMIAEYVTVHSADDDLVPPSWLDAPLKTLKTQTLTAAPPKTAPKAQTARAPRPKDSDSDQPRKPQPPKEKFTVLSQCVSARQSFPKWMFD